MSKTRPPYPVEFRQEAVRMLRSGVPLAGLARELGISKQTLRNWRRQDEANRGERSDALLTDERARLRAMAALFARESDLP